MDKGKKWIYQHLPNKAVHRHFQLTIEKVWISPKYPIVCFVCDPMCKIREAVFLIWHIGSQLVLCWWRLGDGNLRGSSIWKSLYLLSKISWLIYVIKSKGTVKKSNEFHTSKLTLKWFQIALLTLKYAGTGERCRWPKSRRKKWKQMLNKIRSISLVTLFI